MVVNSTSTSLSGQLPAISSTIFNRDTYVYDMMYGAGKTTFNQWAEEHNVAATYDGLGMLVNQAAESFKLWRGVRPNAEEVLIELRKNLTKARDFLTFRT